MVLSVTSLWVIPSASAQSSSVAVTNSAEITYSETSSDTLPVGLKKSKYNFSWAKNNCIDYMTNGQWDFISYVQYASGNVSKEIRTKTTTKVSDYYWAVDDSGEDIVIFTVTCKQTAKIKLTKSSNSYRFCFDGSTCSFYYTKAYLAENNWKVRIARFIDGEDVFKISPLPDPLLYDAENIESMRGYLF